MRGIQADLGGAGPPCSRKIQDRGGVNELWGLSPLILARRGLCQRSGSGPKGPTSPALPLSAPGSPRLPNRGIALPGRAEKNLAAPGRAPLLPVHLHRTGCDGCHGAGACLGTWSWVGLWEPLAAALCLGAGPWEQTIRLGLACPPTPAQCLWAFWACTLYARTHSGWGQLDQEAGTQQRSWVLP